MRLAPPRDTHFIPVTQRNWEEVRQAQEGVYTVYTPDGYPLIYIKDHRYRWFNYIRYYHADASCFCEFRWKGYWRHARDPMKQPEDVLREFASDIGCEISDLVFVPTG